MAKKSKHPMTKKAPHAKQGGGNLSLPKASQSMHVMQQKDKMAGNVGGAAHMQPDAKALGHQELYLSGGENKGAPKKHSLKY